MTVQHFFSDNEPSMPRTFKPVSFETVVQGKRLIKGYFRYANPGENILMSTTWNEQTKAWEVHTQIKAPKKKAPKKKI